MTRSRVAPLGLLVVLMLFLLAPGGAIRARPPELPPILLVARAPDPGGRLPGLGPEGRTLKTGGRLLLRESNGRVRPFLTPGPGAPDLFDAADPAVSFDARLVAFAATTGPDAPWRLWLADADGSNARPLPLPEAPGVVGHAPPDDFDPTFLPDGRLVFASTRFPQRAQAGGGAVSNLFVVNTDGTGFGRLTTERNGAEEPSIDPTSGHVVYARWWLNRFLPAAGAGESSVTTERSRALPTEPVDVWHALIAAPDGDGARLAGGFPRVRHQTMAYQPLLLTDGSLVGVQAEPGSLVGAAPGRPIAHRLLVYPGGFAPARLVADAAFAPAALPDDRLLWSARGPDGSRALYVSERPITHSETAVRSRLLVDTPGFDDLDAVALVARTAPVVAALLPPPARIGPVASEGEVKGLTDTFRFDCLNVFANGPVDGPFPDAPFLAQDLRIRFFATLDRPEAEGGDTLILVREAPLTDRGAVHEHEMPADTPLFEQLVDSEGRVVASSLGPAHVSGFNAARAGTGTKCVGCHVGHSALPVARNYDGGTWTNIAPSAAVTLPMPPGQATDRSRRHAASPRTLVDRRARGASTDVGWVFSPAETATVALDWAFPVEVKTVILYPPLKGERGGAQARIRRIDLIFRRDGHVVRTERLGPQLDPAGARLDLSTLEVDGLDVRLFADPGTVPGRPSVALNEIEVVGRLTDRLATGTP